MRIVFIANYQVGPGGEPADETHLASELESQGVIVDRINRDEWREYVREGFPQNKYKIPEDIHPDLVIISKWHHFYDGSFIDAAKKKWGCPVFYWVWDYMGEHTEDDWHIKMAKSADLYLSGELGLASKYRSLGIRFYYFQFDVCDITYPPMFSSEKLYDVIYTGSCNNQFGRLDLLKEINKKFPIKVFGYDYEEWKKQGFDAYPGVYKFEYNQLIAKSKIVLGTSAHYQCFGYWSNRVGKVLHAGGFLLQLYTPGMELVLGDSCEYFNTPDEAVEKINYYLDKPEERHKFWERNMLMDRERWTSNYKIRQLRVLIDRYLNTKGGQGWELP